MLPLALWAVCLASPPNVPLAIDSANVNAGTIKVGLPLRHTYVLKNSSSTETVVIDKIETGCGCLQQKLSKSTIAPGEMAEWMIELNTLTQPEGDRSWMIRYRASTATGHIDSALAISAKLDREITVTPPMISFSTTNEASQIIMITDRRTNGKLPITIAESSSPHLKATVLDGLVTVVLTATAPADGQLKSETITLRTSDPVYREMKIPVSFVKNTADGIAVTPVKLDIQMSKNKAATIQFRDTAGKLLTIESATSDQPGMTITFSPGANPVVAVKATIDPAVAAKSGSGWLTIKFVNGSSRSVPLSWK